MKRKIRLIVKLPIFGFRYKFPQHTTKAVTGISEDYHVLYILIFSLRVLLLQKGIMIYDSGKDYYRYFFVKVKFFYVGATLSSRITGRGIFLEANPNPMVEKNLLVGTQHLRKKK